MNKINEWNLFAQQRGIVPAICAEFDQIFHTSDISRRFGLSDSNLNDMANVSSDLQRSLIDRDG